MWRSISQRVQALKWSMSTSSPCKWQSLRLSLERVAGASTAWAYPTASARSTMVMFCLAQIGVSWSLTSTRSPFAKNYSYSLAHVHHNLACYMFWQIPTYWKLWPKKPVQVWKHGDHVERLRRQLGGGGWACHLGWRAGHIGWPGSGLQHREQNRWPDSWNHLICCTSCEEEWRAWWSSRWTAVQALPCPCPN